LAGTSTHARTGDRIAPLARIAQGGIARAHIAIGHHLVDRSSVGHRPRIEGAVGLRRVVWQRLVRRGVENPAIGVGVTLARPVETGLLGVPTSTIHACAFEARLVGQHQHTAGPVAHPGLATVRGGLGAAHRARYHEGREGEQRGCDPDPTSPDDDHDSTSQSTAPGILRHRARLTAAGARSYLSASPDGLSGGCAAMFESESA